MSRRIRFIVESAKLQDKNSEEKEQIGGICKADSSHNTNRSEDENRENKRRARASRLQKNTSSTKRDKNKPKSQKGAIEQLQRCEERDRSSSITHASHETVSRKSSERYRVFSPEPGGNIDSIQSVGIDLTLTRRDEPIILVFAAATSVVVSIDEPKDVSESNTFSLVKRVCAEEIIRIFTRSAVKLFGVLAICLIVFVLAFFAKNC